MPKSGLQTTRVCMQSLSVVYGNRGGGHCRVTLLVDKETAERITCGFACLALKLECTGKSA